LSSAVLPSSPAVRLEAARLRAPLASTRRTRLLGLAFVVSMVGPTIDEARHVVEQVVSQVQGMLPETLELAATLVKGEPNRPARTLID